MKITHHKTVFPRAPICQRCTCVATDQEVRSRYHMYKWLSFRFLWNRCSKIWRHAMESQDIHMNQLSAKKTKLAMISRSDTRHEWVGGHCRSLSGLCSSSNIIKQKSIICVSRLILMLIEAQPAPDWKAVMSVKAVTATYRSRCSSAEKAVKWSEINPLWKTIVLVSLVDEKPALEALKRWYRITLND